MLSSPHDWTTNDPSSPWTFYSNVRYTDIKYSSNTTYLYHSVRSTTYLSYLLVVFINFSFFWKRFETLIRWSLSIGDLVSLVSWGNTAIVSVARYVSISVNTAGHLNKKKNAYLCNEKWFKSMRYQGSIRIKYKPFSLFLIMKERRMCLSLSSWHASLLSTCPPSASLLVRLAFRLKLLLSTN